MRRQHIRWDIHLIAQQSRNRDRFAVIGNVVNSDDDVITNMRIPANQTTYWRGIFLRLLLIKNVVTRHLINSEMDMRLRRLRRSRTGGWGGDDRRCTESVRRIADYGHMVHPGQINKFMLCRRRRVAMIIMSGDRHHNIAIVIEFIGADIGLIAQFTVR